MHLREAVLAFLTAKRAANRSARTVDWYEYELGIFQAWIGPIELKQIEPFAIDAYLAHERSRGLKGSSLNARYRSLRAFLNWAKQRGYLSVNPIDHVEEPKAGNLKPDHVRFEDFAQFLARIPADDTAWWVDHRDRLIVHLLFWSGMRANELLQLRLSDVRLDRRTIMIRAGKGNKTRIVPMAPDVPGILNTYLYSRPVWPDDPGHLFYAAMGKTVKGKLTIAGLQQLLRRRCDYAGLPRYLPHAWRHGFAMHMLEYGADLGWISDVMGHADERITRRYAQWRETGLANRLDEIYHRTTA